MTSLYSVTCTREEIQLLKVVVQRFDASAERLHFSKNNVIAGVCCAEYRDRGIGAYRGRKELATGAAA
jgi:hypothetical protein